MRRDDDRAVCPPKPIKYWSNSCIGFGLGYDAVAAPSVFPLSRFLTHQSTIIVSSLGTSLVFHSEKKKEVVAKLATTWMSTMTIYILSAGVRIFFFFNLPFNLW